MATVYLEKLIHRHKNEEIVALETAQVYFKFLYDQLQEFVELLNIEVQTFNSDWYVQCTKFEVDSVICEEFLEEKNSWQCEYFFGVNIKTRIGGICYDTHFCDEINEWYTWKMNNEEMYKEFLEPLAQFQWEGFKRKNVSVQFESVEAVRHHYDDGCFFHKNLHFLD